MGCHDDVGDVMEGIDDIMKGVDDVVWEGRYT